MPGDTSRLSLQLRGSTRVEGHGELKPRGPPPCAAFSCLRKAVLTNEGSRRASVALGNGLLRLVVEALAERLSDDGRRKLFRAIKDEVRGRCGLEGTVTCTYTMPQRRRLRSSHEVAGREDQPCCV